MEPLTVWELLELRLEEIRFKRQITVRRPLSLYHSLLTTTPMAHPAGAPMSASRLAKEQEAFSQCSNHHLLNCNVAHIAHAYLRHMLLALFKHLYQVLYHNLRHSKVQLKLLHSLKYSS